MNDLTLNGEQTNQTNPVVKEKDEWFLPYGAAKSPVPLNI